MVSEWLSFEDGFTAGGDYRVRRGRGVDGERDGIVIGSLLPSRGHLCGVEGCRWAPRLVAYARNRTGALAYG